LLQRLTCLRPLADQLRAGRLQRRLRAYQLRLNAAQRPTNWLRERRRLRTRRCGTRTSRQ